MYDLLRHSHPFWDRSEAFLFRGHADANWKLLPSVWRQDKQSRYASSVRFISPRDEHPTISGADNLCATYAPRAVGEALQQVAMEFRLVEEFHRWCDEVGLPLPSRDIVLDGVSHPIPHEVTLDAHWYTTSRFHRWKPSELFALAQHHGVPTRLLDCTYNPKKALLFAVKEAVDHADRSTEFCVWALPGFYMLNVALQHFEPRGVAQVQIEELRFPRHQNLFLKQQDGRFLVVSNVDYWRMERGGYPDLESLFDWAFGEDGVGRSGIRHDATSIKLVRGHDGTREYQTMGARVYLPLVHKIVAPVSYAEPIYRFLAKDHLTEIHLMPTYDNVARFVDRALVPARADRDTG